jgi:hypothetical protein
MVVIALMENESVVRIKINVVKRGKRGKSAVMPFFIIHLSCNIVSFRLSHILLLLVFLSKFPPSFIFPIYFHGYVFVVSFYRE